MYKLNDDLRDAIVDYILDQTGRTVIITYPDYAIQGDRILFLVDREDGIVPHRINLEKGTISRTGASNGYSRIPRIKEIVESSQKLGLIKQIIAVPSSRIHTNYVAALLGKLRLGETVGVKFSDAEFTFNKAFVDYDTQLEMHFTYDGKTSINRTFDKYSNLGDVYTQIIGTLQFVAGMDIESEVITSSLKNLIKDQ